MAHNIRVRLFPNREPACFFISLGIRVTYLLYLNSPSEDCLPLKLVSDERTVQQKSPGFVGFVSAIRMLIDPHEIVPYD